MATFFVFGAVLAAALAFVTIRGRGYWPLSHYPMFSDYRDPSRVEVFRIALETVSGEQVWWESAFRNYPQDIGHALQHLHAGRPSSLAVGRGADGSKVCLANVLRLVRLEPGAADRYRAFRIVRRTMARPDGQAWVIVDHVVSRVPFADLEGSGAGD